MILTGTHRTNAGVVVVVVVVDIAVVEIDHPAGRRFARLFRLYRTAIRVVRVRHDLAPLCVPEAARPLSI